MILFGVAFTFNSILFNFVHAIPIPIQPLVYLYFVLQYHLSLLYVSSLQIVYPFHRNLLLLSMLLSEDLAFQSSLSSTYFATLHRISICLSVRTT